MGYNKIAFNELSIGIQFKYKILYKNYSLDYTTYFTL